ncbi:hypothetical protein D3C84_888110 [compost metagenome]
MLPSALASFCAPSGVSVVPSLSASCAETAAITLLASSDNARKVPLIMVSRFIVSWLPDQKFTPKLSDR